MNETEKKDADTIDPFKFNWFTFSRISHIEFFNRHNYDVELFGRRIDLSECNINKFQCLLIYSFITQNIKQKARILEITESDDSDILNHFKLRYECYKLVNLNDLEIKDSAGNMLIECQRVGESGKKEFLKKDSFDFIFSSTGINNLSENKENLKNILNNLNTLIKPGGFSLISFQNAAVKDKIWVHNLLYFIFEKQRFFIKIKNEFTNPNTYQEITDLYYVNRNFKNKKLQISKERIFSGEGKYFVYNVLSRKKPTELPLVSLTKKNKLHNKKSVYVFHHLMKCGGSSLVIALNNWFILQNDYLEKSNDINFFMKYKYHIEEFTEDYCLTGHFQYEGIYLYQRYPEIFRMNDKFKIFTFIRDPLKIRISLYYYIMQQGGNNDKSFSLNNSILIENNFLSNLFPCDESNYKEVLDKYYFIGIVDKMQESFDKLADLLGKRKIKLPIVNNTIKDSQISELSDETIQEFKNKNSLDYKIYDYCLNKFSKY